MRNSFAKEITRVAGINKKIILLSGDIGNRLFDEYKRNYQNRFYNCGVAETNMVGVAAGLAVAGFLPVIYTITPFLTSKCFEQIRLDICYPNLNVIIVGTGAGLSYSRLGPTHHSVEDIALMSTIPNISILTPSSPLETEYVLNKAIKNKGPSYLRLGKKGEPEFFKNKKLNFPGNFISKGKDLLILSLGSILKEAVILARELEKKKISSTVMSVNRTKPFDEKFFGNIIKKFKTIIIIEEHISSGGLSSLIKQRYEIFNLKDKRLFTFNTPDKFYTGLGEVDDARKILGINGINICKKVIKRLKK